MNRLTYVLIAGITLTGEVPAAGQSPEQRGAPHRAQRIPIVIDKSGSMAGKKIEEAKEGAKLAIAILDSQKQVLIVDFNDTARKAPFSLLTPNHRQAAMAHIESMTATGGTSYLAALQAADLAPGVPVIFLSDGMPSEAPGQVLDYLKNHPSGPLFTIAVEAPPDAAKLLAQMAAMTGGTFVAVEKSEDLVKALLDIAKALAQYRSYKPHEDTVRCRAAAGKIIAFGFDAVPAITTAGSPAKALFEHEARLPGEQVRLSAIDLPVPTDILIKAAQKRTPQGRLGAILRPDLARAEMEITPPGGNAPAGGTVTAKTRFSDPQGNPIDPRRRPDLASEFQVIDQAGAVVAKAPAKPSATEPALEAQLKLPEQPGPVTIRNITHDKSQGPAFEAQQSRTLLLQKPLPLTVSPARLTVTAKEGRFTATLQLKVISSKPVTATFTAQLDGAHANLRLLGSRAQVDTLSLELEALAPGTYRGTLTVHGAAATPVAAVQVPYEVTITPRLLGLALPTSRSHHLGSVPANAGAKSFPLPPVPSLDQDAADYVVEVLDLASGSAVIPLAAEKTTLSPTKAKPAALTLTAQVGDVPAGDYEAAVRLKLGAGPQAKVWETLVKLTVTETLSAQPLDFGTVEVGKTATQSLLIKNASGPLAKVALVKPVIKAKGDDVTLAAPEATDVPGPGQEKQVPVTVAISPLIESRGLHKGVLRLRRASNQDIEVPVQVTIVGEGEGPAALLVAPAQVQVTARAGEIQQFEVRIKLAADAAPGDDLSALLGGFKDPSGKAQEVDVALEWPGGTKLTRASAVTLKCQIIAPDRPGTYAGQLAIASQKNGTKNLPVSVQVK